MPGRINIAGQRFGRLVVLKKAASRNRHTYWLCRCDCGNEVEVRTDALTRGPTQSCGCYHRDAVTKHGMWESPEYSVWRSVYMRCENPHFRYWANYGGRGIKLCERWRNSFENFYADVGPRPSLDYSLDRIDNDGNYEPGNCRWVTAKEQGRNRRDNRWLTFCGETKCVAEWAETVGLKDSCLRGRIGLGWTLEQALTVPANRYNRWNRPQANE